MQKIAEEMGLPTDVARRLAVQTARGAASMAVESGDSAAELRAKVTSPAGTTERALAIFAEHNIEQIVREAMLGAAARSAEMAAELGAATPTQ
jgi:pyrroline-5-carboxylate reductase